VQGGCPSCWSSITTRHPSTHPSLKSSTLPYPEDRQRHPKTHPGQRMKGKQREMSICSLAGGRSWSAWLRGCKQVQDLQLLFEASPGSLAVAQKQLPGCSWRQGPVAEGCTARTANPLVSPAAFLQNLVGLGVQLTC